MLQPSPFVVLQIRLNLTLPLRPIHRLVQRQQNHLVVTRQHHRVQPALARPHILRRELRELVEAGEPFDLRERGGALRGFEFGEEPEIGVRVGSVSRVRIADVAQDDVAVEEDFREDDAVLEDDRGGRGFRAVRDAGVEGEFRVLDLDGDGADAEAVGGGEGEAGAAVEGGDGGGGVGGEILGGGDGGGVRGGEEEAEVAGAEEVGGVGEVAGGEVRFSNNRHSETPREATSRIGSVRTPEFHMVEALHGEAVGFGVCTDEVVESDELEAIGRGRDVKKIDSKRWRHVAECDWARLIRRRCVTVCLALACERRRKEKKWEGRLSCRL
ncbi:hypothetical protein G2W53_015820 [Senna tora]|uniref:Uncharacterized protein n=1 Tax=Senna tora TaxID=362788 RepID=A0A834WWG8_9FABA|nr:hypothetical protein G2W53_015820 [Senna tora]